MNRLILAAAAATAAIVLTAGLAPARAQDDLLTPTQMIAQTASLDALRVVANEHADLLLPLTVAEAEIQAAGAEGRAVAPEALAAMDAIIAASRAQAEAMAAAPIAEGAEMEALSIGLFREDMARRAARITGAIERRRDLAARLPGKRRETDYLRSQARITDTEPMRLALDLRREIVQTRLDTLPYGSPQRPAAEATLAEMKALKDYLFAVSRFDSGSDEMAEGDLSAMTRRLVSMRDRLDFAHTKNNEFKRAVPAIEADVAYAPLAAPMRDLAAATEAHIEAGEAVHAYLEALPDAMRAAGDDPAARTAALAAAFEGYAPLRRARRKTVLPLTKAAAAFVTAQKAAGF